MQMRRPTGTLFPPLDALRPAFLSRPTVPPLPTVMPPFCPVPGSEEPKHQVGDKVSFVPKSKRKVAADGGTQAAAGAKPSKAAKQKGKKSRATLSFDPEDAI